MTLAIGDGDFFISDEQSLWRGYSLHDFYKVAYTPWEWHAPIMQRARDLGTACFSTYPATAESSNILTIPHLREMFGCEVGLSDHTMGAGRRSPRLRTVPR